MVPATRVVAVGLFVLTGLFLFALGLFLIGDRRMLFRDQFVVHADFEDVAALQTGAKVRVSGMDAGEVTALVIPTTPAGKFRVRLRVREDLHPLIRMDSVAMIQNDGLVGNKFVQIQTGTEQAARVPDGGVIPSREPFDITDLLERSSQTVDTIALTVAQLRKQVEFILTAIADVATNANDVVQHVGAQAEAIAKAGRRISEDTQQIVTEIRAGRGTIGKLVKDNELYVRATTIAQETEAVVKTAREAAERARAAMEDLRGSVKTSDAPMQKMLADLQGTLASAREVTSDLEDNTEALKRSFFFRGYLPRSGLLRPERSESRRLPRRGPGQTSRRDPHLASCGRAVRTCAASSLRRHQPGITERAAGSVVDGGTAAARRGHGGRHSLSTRHATRDRRLRR